MSANPYLDPLTKKVLTKPVGYLRRKPPVTALVKLGIGHLTDQSANHQVTLQWDLNEQAQKDKVFKLTIDDKEVYIDLEEFAYYSRIMFMR